MPRLNSDQREVSRVGRWSFGNDVSTHRPPMISIQALDIENVLGNSGEASHNTGIREKATQCGDRWGNIRSVLGRCVVYLRASDVGVGERASERASANCFKLSSDKFTDNFAFRYTLLNPSLCFAINVVSCDNVMTFRFPRN